jgi:hypothetical protein
MPNRQHGQGRRADETSRRHHTRSLQRSPARTTPLLETFVPHDGVAAPPARETKAGRVLARLTCLALLLGTASCTGGTFVHVPDFPDTSCFTCGVGVPSDNRPN